KSPKELRLSKRFFTYEPYAVGLPHGDSDFRLSVDRGLSRIYRTGAIKPIFGKNFGAATPSSIVKALYLISALPE
ncbi:MAG: amino acid ABC transporter substrate-binding protein, partial [Alphaproteobacteria bacterium]|nr:amino acid ABC transporter substrate-binding protein [Alphaproteobacteria bacterium]